MRSRLAASARLALIVGCLPSSAYAYSGGPVVYIVGGVLVLDMIVGIGMGVATAIYQWPSVKSLYLTLVVSVAVLSILMLGSWHNLSELWWFIRTRPGIGDMFEFTLFGIGDIFAALIFSVVLAAIPIALTFVPAYVICKSARKRASSSQ